MTALSLSFCRCRCVVVIVVVLLLLSLCCCYCRWVVGSLGRWVVGSLGRWVVGSLGRWVVGSLGRLVVWSFGRLVSVSESGCHCLCVFVSLYPCIFVIGTLCLCVSASVSLYPCMLLSLSLGRRVVGVLKSSFCRFVVVSLPLPSWFLVNVIWEIVVVALAVNANECRQEKV